MKAKQIAFLGFILPAPSVLAVLTILFLSQAAQASLITVRSGNGTVGSSDSQITFTSTAATQAFPDPFDAADFAAADSGSAAQVVSAATIHGWEPNLIADPEAKWIAFDDNHTPHSMLFSQSFDFFSSPGPQNIFLDFSFMVDDAIGDAGVVNPNTDPNQQGVFLNGVTLPIQSVFRFGFRNEATFNDIDVTGIINTNGTNTLYVYNRDTAGSVSGVIYTATFRAVSEPPAIILFITPLLMLITRAYTRRKQV